MNREDSGHFEAFRDLFHCPACGGQLEKQGRQLKCASEAHVFPIKDNIPRLFVPNDWTSDKKDITDIVRNFYEKTPFPNYDDFDSAAELIKKSRSGLFARLLDEQIPLGARILEVGCGTGQLSNFLGIAQRHVFGADMCLNSLSLAETFRRKNQLHRVGFYQMNLFRPIFKEASFDIVIANGVLPATNHSYEGFKTIAPLVKPGGYILVGLYNKFGRLITDFRRLIFRFTGKRFIFLDPYLRKRGEMDAKTEAWFADQYQHPHESKQTMGEVLRWFDKNGFQFITSIPKSRFLQPFNEKERLFQPGSPPDPVHLAAVQGQMIFTGSREGGFFTMIGRRH